VSEGDVSRTTCYISTREELAMDISHAYKRRRQPKDLTVPKQKMPESFCDNQYESFTSVDLRT
jgi:hypothetical protein